jgi:putative nucleotidyltransferase with HDIG domain
MTPERTLFLQIGAHLLEDKRPSDYLRALAQSSVFDRPPFHLLAKLADTCQSPVHHPEGHVWNHTLLVVDAAARLRTKSRDPEALMWAALLRDVGKPDTTRIRKGRITAYDHDKLGAGLAGAFCAQAGCDTRLTQTVTALVRWHMKPRYVWKSLPFADIGQMNRQADIREVALLGLCDRLGRVGADPQEELRQHLRFRRRCRQFLTGRAR